MKNIGQTGICIPSALLPSPQVDLKTWSVVACDQYTQDGAYWEQVERNVQGRPSAFNLILPEIYLDTPDSQYRIQKIHHTMAEYIQNGIFAPETENLIYTERATAHGRTRRGLIAAIDLDAYDWQKGSAAPIRATEETIEARLPPRMEIRNGAPLELPHIMLLINDKERALMHAAAEQAKIQRPLYSTELMMGGGCVTGWAVQDSRVLHSIESALERIAFQNKDPNGNTFLFAVGDGNHSLAAAKAVWQKYRQKQIDSGADEKTTGRSPIRYALAEIVNLYDEGLTFEPIHRVIFNAVPEDLMQYICRNLGAAPQPPVSREEAERAVRLFPEAFAFACRNGQGITEYTVLKTGVRELMISRLQPILDTYISQQKLSGKPDISIDYIHGSDEAARLASKQNAAVLLLPPIRKETFFTTIGAMGTLPRKSFSMGEADEKRFYLEARRLFG